jgi:hypothetical protein
MNGLGNVNPNIINAMMSAGTGGIENTRNPRTAFFAGDEALKRYKNAGYTRNDWERSLDYVSPEDNTTRRYITDEGMKVADPAADTLGAVMAHPRMYAAYPSLKNIPVSYEDRGSALGAYSPDSHTLNINNNALKKAEMLANYTPEMERLGLVGHETQHAITAMEGWDQGLGHMAEAANNPELYWNSGNEAQSRFVGDMIRDKAGTMKAVDKLGGSLPWMRDDMKSITGSPLMYKENGTKVAKEFIAKEKAAEDFFNGMETNIAKDKAREKAAFISNGGTAKGFEKEYSKNIMMDDY